jgi:hypothetical protein
MTTAASTFDTYEPNVGELLSNIRTGKIQLPDFQRGWVWDDNRIRALIASVSMSYPIGAIMTMEVSDEIKFFPRFFEGVENKSKIVPETLVLDGQQRLTSLYLSLIHKEAVKTKNEKKLEILRYYYLDMAGCLNPEIDRFDAVVSVPESKIITRDFGRTINLDLSSRENEYRDGMIPLNLIFDATEYVQWKNGFLNYFKFDPVKMQFLNDFDMNIWLRFQQYKVHMIRLTKNTPKEAVCQVFENVNTGGKELTVFELMTATFAADGYRLRDDWEKRKKQLYAKKILKGVDESAFLTAITLLTTYQNSLQKQTPVSCKRKDVLRLTLEDYTTNADAIVQGLITASRLLANEKIFDDNNLPYQTQLIPLTVICAYLGSQIENVAVKEKIIRWYWNGVFGELYGGANEYRFSLDVQGVITWINGGDLPATIRDANFSPVRLLTLQSRLSAAYKGLMAQLMKAGSKDFINGDTIEITTYFDQAVDIHHIFPRAYCEKQNLPREKWNSIINKAPLSSRTNRIIGGHKPSTYLQTIEKEGIPDKKLDSILESHLVNPELIRADDFNHFIQNRAGHLLDLIEKAMGKTISGRDSDEVYLAFGGVL